MTETNKIGAVDFLRDKLAEIDQRLTELFAVRNSVAEDLERLTGAEPAPFGMAKREPIARSPVQAEAAAPPMDPIPSKEPPLTTTGPSGRVYHSRQFNKRFVQEALDIILKNGRPMSTPEIMRTHSMREEVTPEALYRLMYNRVVTGKVMSLDGAFWPEGKPLPAGWSLEQARRSTDLKAQ